MRTFREQVMRGSLWLLASVLGLWLVAVLLVAVVLGVPPVRNFVLGHVLSYLEGPLGMHIEADLATLGVRGVAIKKLRVDIPKEGYFIRADEVALDYHLVRLVSATPEVDAVRLVGARVVLPASLFEASPDEPEDGSPTTIPRFHVAHIEARDGEVRARAFGDDYVAVLDHVTGEVTSRAQLRADVTDGALSLSSSKGELVALLHLAGHWDEGGSTKVATDGRLLGRPFTLAGEVETVYDRVPDGELTLSADGVDGKSLALLGLDTALLKKPVQLALTVGAEHGALNASLDASAPGALLKIIAAYGQGSVDARIEASARSLIALSSVLPDMAVAAHVTANGQVVPPYDFTLAASHMALDGSALPDLNVAGQLVYPELRIKHASSPQYAKQVAASGAYNIDTSAARGELEVHGLGLARLVPGSQGRLSGSAHFSMIANEVRAAGAFNLLDVFLDPVRFSQASADVSAVGPLDALSLTASVRAAHVFAGPVELESVLADVRGAGKRFDAVVDVRERRSNAKLQLAYTLGDEQSTLTARGRGKVGERELTLSALLKMSKDVLHAELALAGSGDEKLELRADQLPNALNASLQTTRIQYGPWLEEFGVHGVKGAVELKVNGGLPRKNGVYKVMEASALGKVAFDARTPDLAQIDPSLAGIASDVNGTLSIDGTWDEPDLSLDLTARAERDGAVRATSDRLEINATADAKEIEAKLVAYDAKGQLAGMHVSTALGLNQIAALMEEEGAKIPRLKSQLQIEPRRLDQQTGLLAYYTRSYALAIPISFGGMVDVEAEGDDLKAALDLDVTLYGSALDARCVAGSDTRVSIHASTERREIKATLKSAGQRGGALVVNASSSLMGEITAPKIGPIGVTAQAKELYLPGLAGFCTLRDGRAGLDVRILDLNGEKLTGSAKLRVDDLRADAGPAVDVRADVELAPAKLRASAELSADKSKVGTLRAELPLVGESMPNGVAMDKPVSATLTLKELPIGALLAVGDALGQAKGTIDAEVHVGGTLQKPEPKGSVTLDDISLSIASLAQPLQHIRGTVSLDGRKVVLKNLSARDRDGKVSVDGWASVDQAMRTWADVRVVSNEFPLRRQGRIAGELTIDTRFRIEGSPLAAIQAKLAVNGGRLWLQDASGGDVQSMAEHPDVRFADEEDLPDAAKKEEEEGAPAFALSLLTIESTKDLWVQHTDFSVQLGLDLALVGQPDGMAVKGEAAIRRGNLMLLGRAFDIDKGSIRFAGDAPPNPELNLKATYAPPSGQKLVVTVSGRASGPTVAFSGAATTAAEALAIVSGVGRANQSAGAEQKAQSDARGFATGLTAGLLSATVRRELGDWVPLISVENDSAGRVRSARAGVDASKLIPKFMRGFTRGAYLEGVVGNQQTKPGGRVGLGVRLELTLPKDFLTSVGYGPGPNWSTDLAWAP